MHIISIGLLVLSISYNIECARIFAVIPTPAISHQVPFRPLVHELLKRGHEVVVVTTDPEFPKGQAPENLTVIDVHFSYKVWRETYIVAVSKGDSDIFSQLKIGYKYLCQVFCEQMQTKEVQEILQDKSKKFDLLLLEALARPALVLTHILKAPTIQVSSFGAALGNYEIIGAPVHPILHPAIFRKRIYNLKFWEKVTELYMHYKQIFWYHFYQAEENKIIKEVFGSDIPTLSKLSNNVDMMFLNMHSIWEGNRPVPPNVIYMGGLPQKPIKELPEVIQ